MVGFAAVQVSLERGARVIATAGETFAGRLRDLGAQVTSYGEGMVGRVREIAGGAPDLVLHTAQVKGVLPDLIQIVDGDPRRVMSIGDADEGQARRAYLGERTGSGGHATMRLPLRAACRRVGASACQSRAPLAWKIGGRRSN